MYCVQVHACIITSSADFRPGQTLPPADFFLHGNFGDVLISQTQPPPLLLKGSSVLKLHSLPLLLNPSPYLPFHIRPGNRMTLLWRLGPPVRWTSLRKFASHPKRSADSDLELARSWLKDLHPNTIPRHIGQVSFSRSSGPGGQNVNKSVQPRDHPYYSIYIPSS